MLYYLLSLLYQCGLDADRTPLSISNPSEVTSMHKVVLNHRRDDHLVMGMHSLACALSPFAEGQFSVSAWSVQGLFLKGTVGEASWVKSSNPP